jgi:hypothetical protein
MKTTVALRILLVVTAITALAVYVLYIIPELGRTTFDDAYMFLRYAKHWLAGAGFSWNIGEGPAYGITSFTHLLLVTAALALTNLTDPQILTGISFLAGLGAVAVLTLTGFVFFGQLRRYWLPLLVIPCLVLSWLLTYHSTTGMETTLSLLCNALLVAALLFFARSRTLFSLLLCAATAYLSYLTRPDNGLYCLLLPPLYLLARDRRLWRPAALYLAVFLLLLGGDLFLKKALFGSFFPLPYFVKSTGGFYRGYIGGYLWNVGDYMFLFLRESLPYLVAVVLFAGRKSLPEIIAVLVPVGLTFAYYLGVTQIMGFDARYYYPSLPFVVLAAFIAVDSALAEGSACRRLRGGAMLRAVVVVILLTFLSSYQVRRGVRYAWAHWVLVEPAPCTAQQVYRSAGTGTLPQLGWWEGILAMDRLLDQLPPDIVIATSEYGYIGARHPDMEIIDLAGLHDNRTAHSGFSMEAILARRPDIIWFPHHDYTYTVKLLLDSRAFAANYDYYPGLYDYGLAVRRDSSHREEIERVLGRECAKLYPGTKLAERRAVPLPEPVKQ